MSLGIQSRFFLFEWCPSKRDETFQLDTSEMDLEQKKQLRRSIRLLVDKTSSIDPSSSSFL